MMHASVSCGSYETKYLKYFNNVLLKEEDYPNDSLYFIDIYIENRETNLKILYGTYYPEGFEEKYEVINESY